MTKSALNMNPIVTDLTQKATRNGEVKAVWRNEGQVSPANADGRGERKEFGSFKEIAEAIATKGK